MTDFNEGGQLALQDHVLVEVEILGQIVGLRTVVVKIAPEELWLGLTRPDGRLELLEPGRSVDLTVARPGFALIGRSRFIRHLGESRSRIFAIAPAPDLERRQRRAHPRVAIELETRFRKVDPVTGEAKGKATDGSTLDAGPGGMLVRTSLPLTVGDLVELTLSLSGSEKLSAAARVARIRDGEPAAEGRPPDQLVGLKFTRITAVDQQRILKVCMLLQHRREAAAREARSAPVATPVEGSLPAVAPAPPATPAAPAAPAPPASTAPDPALAEAVARAKAAQAARQAQRAAESTARREAPAETPRPISPVQARLAELPTGTPLIAVGLALCEAGSVAEVRRWFDGLEPFDRIGLLSNLQANMHGDAVDGAAEPFVVQPLAQALGLIQKTA